MRKLKLLTVILLAALCLNLASAQTWTSAISFPSFTDTTDPNSWRSWICLANPYSSPTDYNIDIWDQNGGHIGSKTGNLPALSSIFIRPRNIVGYDCAGSATVVSTIPISGVLEKTRNNNQMTNSYNGERMDYEILTGTRSLAKNITIGNKTSAS